MENIAFLRPHIQLSLWEKRYIFPYSTRACVINYIVQLNCTQKVRKLFSIKYIFIIYYYVCIKEKKVHRFTNNLQGLQKVMVKDFSWNIIPWNALLFEKTLKQLSILVVENYGFILNTCHDTAKRAGFPVIFSRLRWPLKPLYTFGTEKKEKSSQIYK